MVRALISEREDPPSVHDNRGFRIDGTVSPVPPRIGHASSVSRSVQEEPSASEDSNSSLAKSQKDRSFLGRCRRKAWLLPLIHTQFWYAACFSLLAPYFPPLAESKGLSASKYGFVFSSLKATMLIGSIVTERLMVYMKPSTVYLIAQGGYFLCALAFGALYWSPGGDILLGLAITAAMFGGFLGVMYGVCMYSIVIERFTGNSGIIIASMECLWGIGNMTGAILGGALIDEWDYPLPFFVIACIMMLSFPVIAKRGPIPKAHRRVITDDISSGQAKYYKAFCDPVFLVAMVTVMLSWVIFGFNEPTLEPYLRQFNLTSTETGSVFMVQYGSYCLGALPVGILCNRHWDEFFMFVGQSLTAIAYLILGPAPFLPISPSLWMIYLSQVFTGVGMSCQFVCSYTIAHKRLLKKGYPDTIRTSGFVSSCLFTFLVFGAITTPPLAGFLVERLGYRMGTMPLFAILALWSGVTFVLWLSTLCSKETTASTSDVTPKQGHVTTTASVPKDAVDYAELYCR
ncbi:MFS-type transporter SLC18B1-like [Ornithodoros turicata]|uniref:MFS-type transporter SLC18B1-like n=1 Tax=Ornithodoros turicata TaxID=34597 RepID=UPI003139E61E